MKIHTYLNFEGSSEDAFNFYKSIFGGEFTSVVKFTDFPMEGVEIPEKDQDKMMHIGLPIGENLLMASDTLEAFGQKLVQGNNVHISVQPDSKEEADRIFNALSQGGEVGMPIEEQVWGDYYGHLTDKFGVQWMVNFSQQRA